MRNCAYLFVLSGSMKFAYIPEGFHPEEVLPAKLINFSDDARYFTHKLYEQRIFGKRSKEDFIPLKAAYLRKIISFRHYQQIRTALLRSRVIETDNHYIKGEKATGYRLGPKYRDVRHKKVELTNKRLLKNIQVDKETRESLIELDVHAHLFRQLRRLEINYDGALASLDDEDFISNHVSVEMIRDRNWFFIPDKYGRVHTNLTNLKGCLRQHLSVEDSSLCEIDIVNSQPFFFGVILCAYMRDQTLPSFNSHHPLPYDVTSNPLDVQRYLELVQGGELYEYLAEKFQISLEDRRLFKVKLFSEIFFCKNAWKTKYGELFKVEFPTVYSVIRKLKEKDYTALSKHLQKVESSFIINKVVRRCMNIDEEMFVGTIHDSLLVQPANAELVEQVIKDEFGPWGLIPTVKRK